MYVPPGLREQFEEHWRRERFEREIHERRMLELEEQKVSEWKNRMGEKKEPGKSEMEIPDAEPERPTIDPKYTELKSSNEGPSIEKSKKDFIVYLKPEIEKSKSNDDPAEPDIKPNRKPQSELLQK
jgi:hypothetical protein